MELTFIQEAVLLAAWCAFLIGIGYLIARIILARRFKSPTLEAIEAARGTLFVDHSTESVYADFDFDPMDVELSFVEFDVKHLMEDGEADISAP